MNADFQKRKKAIWNSGTQEEKEKRLFSFS